MLAAAKAAHRLITVSLLLQGIRMCKKAQVLESLKHILQLLLIGLKIFVH
jgi:hypothetical protein